MEATKLQNDIQELNDAIEVEKLVVEFGANQNEESKPYKEEFLNLFNN